MKKNMIIAIAIILAIACSRSPYPGYDKTDNGLYYKIERGNSEKQLPVEGDVLTVEMSYYLQENDSLLFSAKDASEPIMLPVQKSLFRVISMRVFS